MSGPYSMDSVPFGNGTSRRSRNYVGSVLTELEPYIYRRRIANPLPTSGEAGG